MSNLNLIPIGKLFDLEKGSLQSSKCTEGEYTFITAAEEWKTHNEYSHECEALIFAAAASGSLGRTHYINDKFITSDLCFILTPKDSKKYPINLKFYHFVFNSLKDEIVKNTKSGTSKESINQSNLRNYEIPYFEIDKQNLWIDKLVNTKLIKEDLELELSTGQSLLKQLKQAILQEAIEGKLTAQWRAKNPDIGTAKKLLEQIKTEKEKLIKEKKLKASKPLPPINEDEIPFDIPQNWEWCRLGDISFVGTGATPLTSEPKYYNGDINWITSSATGADFVTEAETKITELALKETNCQIYPIGTLVIAMYGQGKTRGQITELMIDSATNQACAAILIYLKDKVLNQFIKKYFQKIYLEIRELASGGAQPNLNMQKVKDTMISLPPLEEQNEIVSRIEKLFVICDELESEINKNKTTVDNLMATVLKDTFEN
ncbi:restriction endonuclease subunit S [Aliarcobacter butzleri]|uniref:restriction endonuclease subunit S n=1 Tax=Aliarcobacter butzleri TaxID=28197 RepID=UPI0024DE5082|nr:restriction endonuclease subunit S [Aliarcobacter butzleri]MDK2091656.1 restriction endonuclease subunit S [Aliarcobacter butzleri]